MLHEVSRREQIDMELLARYHRDGDLFAREELAERCMPLVKSMARKYSGRGEEMEDLVQAGTIGLVKAIDRFDLEAGHRFVSFAAPNIQGEIRRHFRDHTWAVHVPRSLQELDAKVQSARRAVVADTGREPTDDDLADELQTTVTDIREARSAGQSYRALSMDAPAGEARNLAEVHGSPEPGYEQVEAEVTLQEAMTALTARERRVLDMRFNEERLQREIAEEIGVSQMQVSRIISGAIERMSEYVGASDEPASLAA
ncbi:SigB/SigF/SigG family RNA polymerase sigma factor [Patulibacter sp. NPDC049589]|uniref:SigB/SigF/SigG family RNA polymerase sigma factor n=1 Tax=Patulibacter sp. NPDC049589 TaxID=3154731 RepID=UPI0034187423